MTRMVPVALGGRSEFNKAMRFQRFYLLFWCVAVGLVAFMLLDYWSHRNAPLYRRLERQWQQDVEALENNPKLPKAWFDVKELEIIGGTPESRNWLKRIQIPIKTNPEGNHKLEVLVVAWEENGKRGALVQYNFVDIKTGNNTWELGRTFILSRPGVNGAIQAFFEAMTQ